MRKIKIMSMFFTMLIAMTGCSIQISFDGKNDPPAETEPETTELTMETTEIITETEPETEIKITETTTEAIPETQAETEPIVIAEPVAMTESVEEFGFTDYGASNLVNSGICCTDGQNYYYCDTNTKKLYQKTDGNFTVLSDNFYGYYLNLAQNIIYYADTTSDNFVTAYDVQSGQKQVICGKHAFELTLYQDKLYFSTTEGNRKIIYRVNTDGTELEQLSGCEDLWYMTIYKDVIYYVNYENETYAIMSMNLDGSDLKTIHKYNASDLCIAEDKIFFAERDTRYLYSMNLDGSNVQQLNATYSRCINYMNGQLYYYGSKENNRTIYSCDLNGNITGRYASGAKFLMLMGQEIYYYDWDEQLHILSLSEKSESDNYIHGTNITLYQQEEVLAPVRIYLDSNWSGYTLDESTIIKDNTIWMMTLYYNNAEYQIVIDLTTGRMTITCLVNDILPTTVYLYDNNNTVPVADTSIQLSEEELRSLAEHRAIYDYSVSASIVCFEYHDYDKNGTYEAYAILAHTQDAGKVSESDLPEPQEVMFISSDGKITIVYQWQDIALFDSESNKNAYIEYSNKGFFLPTLSTGSITYNLMFSVKNNEPFQIEDLPRRVGLDEDGNLSYSGACTACYNNIEHKHVLIYHDDTQSVETTIVYN